MPWCRIRGVRTDVTNDSDVKHQSLDRHWVSRLSDSNGNILIGGKLKDNMRIEKFTIYAMPCNNNNNNNNNSNNNSNNKYKYNAGQIPDPENTCPDPGHYCNHECSRPKILLESQK